MCRIGRGGDSCNRIRTATREAMRERGNKGCPLHATQVLCGSHALLGAMAEMGTPALPAFAILGNLFFFVFFCGSRRKMVRLEKKVNELVTENKTLLRGVAIISITPGSPLRLANLV